MGFTKPIEQRLLSFIKVHLLYLKDIIRGGISMKKTRRVVMSLLLVLSLAVAMLATPVANASRPSQAEIDEGSSKMPAYQRDSMKKL